MVPIIVRYSIKRGMVFAKNATKSKSNKFKMLNNLSRSIIVYIILASTVFTQNRIEGTGVGLDGSTGLFLNPSSETIGVGHIRLGTSHFIFSQYQQVDKKIPFSLSSFKVLYKLYLPHLIHIPLIM